MCCEAFVAVDFYRDSLLIHSLGPFHVLLQVLCFPCLLTFLNLVFLAKMKKNFPFLFRWMDNICVLGKHFWEYCII